MLGARLRCLEAVLSRALPSSTRVLPQGVAHVVHTPPAPPPWATAAATGFAKAAKAGKGSLKQPSFQSPAEFDVAAVQRRFDAALDALHRELGKLRGGRASSGLLDRVVVPSPYGDGGPPQPLVALGTVVVRDAHTLVVHLYDPSTCAAVEAGIRAANLGLQPQTASDAGGAGHVVTVPVPPPSGEYKARMLKTAATVAETARATGRRVRQDALDKVRQAAQGGSADDAKRLERQVQAAADAYTKAVAAAVDAKEKEL